MRNLVIIFLLIASISGCISQVVKSEVSGNALRLRRFNALASQGKTTREQERRMLEASQKAFEALDENINGVAPVGSGS